MGTTYNIKVVTKKPLSVKGKEGLQAQIDARLDAYNRVMSTYILDSEISRFNRAEVESWIPVSSTFYQLATLSHQVSRVSRGAFDPTIGELIELWGFGSQQAKGVPTDQAITSAKNRSGFHKLEISSDRQALRKTQAITLDYSAIAKGDATEVLAQLLLSGGYTNFLVEIGGELRVQGLNASGSEWVLGVEQPSSGVRHQPIAAIQVSNAAVATSGDYRNYYEVDGRRISHTIDPMSGEPITHKLASVTVIASHGALADAYATAFNVLGPDKAYALASKLDIPAYFLIKDSDDFMVRYTSSFEPYILKP